MIPYKSASVVGELTRRNLRTVEVCKKSISLVALLVSLITHLCTLVNWTMCLVAFLRYKTRLRERYVRCSKNVIEFSLSTRRNF